VEVTINNPISREELVPLAIKLRNDLFDYEDRSVAAETSPNSRILPARWLLQS
jgi:hypothetical protein